MLRFVDSDSSAEVFSIESEIVGHVAAVAFMIRAGAVPHPLAATVTEP